MISLQWIPVLNAETVEEKSNVDAPATFQSAIIRTPVSSSWHHSDLQSRLLQLKVQHLRDSTTHELQLFHVRIIQCIKSPINCPHHVVPTEICSWERTHWTFIRYYWWFQAIWFTRIIERTGLTIDEEWSLKGPRCRIKTNWIDVVTRWSSAVLEMTRIRD